MRQNILIFGFIIGTILCVNMVLMINLMYTNTAFKGNDFVGYAAMVVFFSLIFFGVRNYRNKFLDGKISFGQAFITGALITLVASTMYVVVWLFYYNLFVPDFIDVYTEHVLSNIAPEEVATKTKEMADFKEMYKNPLFLIMITYSEVLPIGLVVALLSAVLLRKQ